jgi:hypothetical protein
VPSNGKHLIFLLTNYTPVMKKIIFFVTANLIAATAFTQFIYKIKADSVLITNDSCNAELNLENRTKDTIGFLYNRGKGRTEFRRGAIKINNSTYLIGADTIITGGGGAVEIALNGLTKVNDTIKLGGDLIENTNINLQQKRLRFYLSDPTSSSTSAGGVTITGARGVGSGNDPLYVQIFNRPAGSFSGTSVFAETFWQPTAPVPSGSYSNYISVHKSDNANIDMSGLSLYDYRTIFYVNNVNQNYGSRYHFYADGSTGNNPIMTNHMGLYVAPLKRPTIANAYAIYSAGVEDSIFNAGPVRWTKYKNNALGDSVLTTDINGNVKLKFISSGGGEANTASNTGTVGTGLFKQKTGVNLEFYKINPASNKLSIALNGTDRVDLDVNEANLTIGNLSGSLPAVKMPALTGDVTTVAGTVATTIANDVVTYGKMQNVSATQRILGRNSAGAGDPEEVTLTQLLDWVGSAAQGDILYRGASGWTKLTAGAANQVLSMNSGLPAWTNTSRLLAKRTSATAAIGNTETVVLAASIPANTLAVGDVIRLTSYGIQTNTATASTSVYRFRVGPTTLTGNIAASSSWINGTTAKTNIIVSVSADILITAIGAGGTVLGQVSVYKGYVSATTPTGGTATVTINTTVVNLAEFTFISGAANTTHTFHTATIQIIKN